MTGTYSQSLVVFSLLVAILASYTALDMAGRLATTRGRVARWWLAGGAGAMGLGIWSMHFIGMLAFHLPIPVGYDLAITLYSILIAIGAAGAALWIAFRLRLEQRRPFVLRGLASLVMGLAIVGMHYTGMAAAHFPEGAMCGAAYGEGIETKWLAVLVIVTTLATLGIALIASVFDRQMRTRTGLLADSLAQANEKLMQAALHDPLTQLPNRMLLQDRIEQAIEKAQRRQFSFAVMFCDLDGFKAINDAYGHQLGDQLLIQVSKRITALLRAQDTFARLGGDEFVIVFQVEDPEDAAVVAERIIASVAEPFEIDALELQVSASLGIALYPADATTERDLMAHADAAMYHTKDSGRNGYTFFTQSLNVSANRQLKLLQELRKAVSRGELVLHYQPKFQASGTSPIGAEALVRWQHPELGLLSPDAFIPIAERSGLILSIGDWVLDQACAQLRHWHDAGHPDWTMAVNLSPLQFGSSTLLETVRRTLDKHGLDPKRLTLEVTETTAMRDVEASLLILHGLTAMGVNISIDDFGTGYSSLLYLKRMPATELKIDRAFVHDLEDNAEDAAIVSSIIALGRSLQLQIVAEGVETAGQRQYLSDMGCDQLQGYHLGRPVDAAEFMRLAKVA